MADEVDMSQETQERWMTQALADRLNAHYSGESLTECEDCGNEIPEARRLAVPGCTRCVKCQSSHENPSSRRN